MKVLCISRTFSLHPLPATSCDANIADSQNIQLSCQASRSKMQCPS